MVVIVASRWESDYEEGRPQVRLLVDPIGPAARCSVVTVRVQPCPVDFAMRLPRRSSVPGGAVNNLFVPDLDELKIQDEAARRALSSVAVCIALTN